MKSPYGVSNTLWFDTDRRNPFPLLFTMAPASISAEMPHARCCRVGKFLFLHSAWHWTARPIAGMVQAFVGQENADSGGSGLGAFSICAAWPGGRRTPPAVAASLSGPSHVEFGGVLGAGGA